MNPREIAKLLLPILIIPLTLYAVKMFGHIAGNIIIGAVFLYGIVKVAEGKERRFMLILAIFATIFEIANVASGVYLYIGVFQVPIWVGLGWGVLGLYLMKNLPTIRKVSDQAAYALAAAIYLFIWVYSGMSLEALIPSVFAVIGVYVLTISTKMPASFFLTTGIFGMLIEFMGTSLLVWQYYDGLRMAIPAPLPNLGLAYASTMAFCLWLSGLD